MPSYLGQCDRVRRRGVDEEAKWGEMMARAKPISIETLLRRVDISPLLDEGETPRQFLAELARSDPSTAAYSSWWGKTRCWFIATSGFEFIFLS